MRSPVLVLLALPLLEACGFGVPLKQPTVVPDQAQRGAALALGEASRDDVHAALGEPVIGSDFWRVEVYRADDKRTELGFAVVLILPVPVGVFSEKRHGHVLVAYDADGRVAGVSSGFVSDGMLAADSAGWMTLRADTVSFVVDPVRTRSRATLLADAGRLADYLAQRRRADGCTLVAACEGDVGCPDRLAIDDGEPLDPSPVTALCAEDAACPHGTPLAGTPIDGRHFVVVPLVLALDLAPGPHHLRWSGPRGKEGPTVSFDCPAGDVRYAALRNLAGGPPSIGPTPPSGWEDRPVALVRDGRWLVRSEPR